MPNMYDHNVIVPRISIYWFFCKVNKEPNENMLLRATVFWVAYLPKKHDDKVMSYTSHLQ